MTERYISPCPLPDAYEREILTIMIEEACEVGQRATKVLRFGIDDKEIGNHSPNRERLSRELGDMACMVEMAMEIGLVDRDIVRGAQQSKRSKVAKFLQSRDITKTGSSGNG